MSRVIITSSRGGTRLYSQEAQDAEAGGSLEPLDNLEALSLSTGWMITFSLIVTIHC